MPTWSVATVDEQPDITLQCWRVYETERGEHHFVGYCIENESGRVSSAIVSFDAKSGAGITRSGRRYVLSGEPGFSTRMPCMCGASGPYAMALLRPRTSAASTGCKRTRVRMVLSAGVDDERLGAPR